MATDKKAELLKKSLELSKGLNLSYEAEIKIQQKILDGRIKTSEL